MGGFIVDNVSASVRSAIMARVHSKGNRSTEQAVARAFRVLGVRNWRRHVAIRFSSAGNHVRPDFVFRDSRLVVFVDGCLWHRCPLHARIPSTNRAYWSDKLRRNVLRDRIADQLLTRAGWRVIRIWEHSIKRDPLRCGKRVLRHLSMRLKSPRSRISPTRKEFLGNKSSK